MVVERMTFQAKYGRGHDLGRVLADASGRMYTVVWEKEFESLSAWEEAVQKVYDLPEFQSWFTEMEPLVEQGSREFYVVEPHAGEGEYERVTRENLEALNRHDAEAVASFYTEDAVFEDITQPEPIRG